MKILIISPGILPIPAIEGGAVETLVEMLINSDELCNKHDLTLYTIYNEENYLKKQKCNVKFIKTNNFFYKIIKIIRHIVNRIPNIYIGNTFIYSVVKDIKKEKDEYDIIIVENEPQYGLILKKAGITGKLVLHLHNNYLNKNSRMAYKIKNCYDAILSISKALNEEVKKINSKKTKEIVLYNGIDTKKFNIKNNDSRKKYNINEDEFVFMYSGRLVREKGVKELISAFNLINQKEYKAKLIIAGKVSNKRYYNELKKLSKTNKENIIFLENIKYSEMPELCAISNVGVVPTLYLEAFGLVVIEFLASYCPVIISNCGAMKELVNNIGNNAIVVNYSKKFVNDLYLAMKKYLDMPKEKFENYRKNARLNAGCFTVEKYLKNFLNIIERL